MKALNLERRRSISIRAVALGIVLFLILGPAIIALFGFTYKYSDDSNWFIQIQKISGTTPMFWLGTLISAFGLAILIGGLVGFVIQFGRTDKRKWPITSITYVARAFQVFFQVRECPSKQEGTRPLFFCIFLTSLLLCQLRC
jgi:hypothetical protein